MIISILIPTYNRASSLDHNLKILSSILCDDIFKIKVCIIISNNASSDNTNLVVGKYANTLNIKYFSHRENIGLEKNALFVLKQANTPYVMYLGDDDYISKNYLRSVLYLIEQNENIRCIVPSWQGILLDGTVVEGIQRDIYTKSKWYSKGIKSCMELSWRGHQLSGLVFKSDNLYNSYLERGLNNIYPFLYFVAYSCLNGESYHLTTYPILVTQPGQEKKDWTYGKDGLITEMLNNYKLLDANYLFRFALQVKCITISRDRITSYHNLGLKSLFKMFWTLLINKNTLIATRFFFLLYMIYLCLRYCRKIFKRK
jgi:abequosyltransferase